MRKLILFLSVAAIVASGFGAYKAYQSFRPKNALLAMNIEALANEEVGEQMKGDEYYRGQTGTNWQVYKVLCSGDATQVTEHSDKYEWKFDAVTGMYYVGLKSSTSGSSYSGTKTETRYDAASWYKDVCGKGAGLCLEGAPKGHPCAE